MTNKVKEYFNGSMEPEPENERHKESIDLSIAGRTFNTLGIIAIAVSLILFPVMGFQITILLFGITFIGISIILKTQEEILHKLKGVHAINDQPNEDGAQGEEL